MLARENRFHGHRSLGFVYRKGQAVRDRLMTIKYITNPRRRHPRVSVVVSRKVCKSAVGRNRIRRRVYEIMRQRLSQLTAVYDIVVIASTSEIGEMVHHDLVSSVDNLLLKAGAIREATSDIITKKES